MKTPGFRKGRASHFYFVEKLRLVAQLTQDNDDGEAEQGQT